MYRNSRNDPWVSFYGTLIAVIGIIYYLLISGFLISATLVGLLVGVFFYCLRSARSTAKSDSKTNIISSSSNLKSSVIISDKKVIVPFYTGSKKMTGLVNDETFNRNERDGLVCIDIKCTEPTSISNFLNINDKSLKYLRLDGPFSFFDLPANLEYLSVSNLKPGHPPLPIEKLEKLKFLELQNLWLRNYKLSFPNLLELKLNGCLDNRYPLLDTNEILKIELSGNRLSKMNYEYFSLPKLKVLDLSNNSIYQISLNKLKKVKKKDIKIILNRNRLESKFSEFYIDELV